MATISKPNTPLFVGSNIGWNSGTSTVVVNKPAGTVDGDLLIATLTIDSGGSARTVTPPASWVTQFYHDSTNSYDTGMGIYFRTAATEGASWTFTINSSYTGACSVVVNVYRNVTFHSYVYMLTAGYEQEPLTSASINTNGLPGGFHQLSYSSSSASGQYILDSRFTKTQDDGQTYAKHATGYRRVVWPGISGPYNAYCTQSTVKFNFLIYLQGESTTLLADAQIVKRYSSSFVANSHIKGFPIGSITADAEIQRLYSDRVLIQSGPANLIASDNGVPLGETVAYDVEEYRVNFCDNGSFENGVAGWSGATVRGTDLPPSYVAAMQATSPNGWWRLGEAGGTTADNAQGSSALDGTYVNNPTFGVTGPLVADADKAITLNGSNQSISIPSGTALSATTAVTVAAWVKRSGPPSSSEVVFDRRMRYLYTGYCMLFSSGGEPYLYCGGPGTDWGQNAQTASVCDGSWHFVVMVRNVDASYIYVDGVQQYYSATTYAGVGSMAGTSDATIGSYLTYNPASTEFWEGSLDEVAVWTRALSSTEQNSLWLAARAQHTSTIAQVTDNATGEGIRAASVSVAAMQWAGIGCDMTGPFVAGTPYYFSVSAKTTSGATGFTILMSSAENNNDYGEVVVTLTGSWVKYTGVWVPTQTYATAGFAMVVYTAAAATFRMDGVIVRPSDSGYAKAVLGLGPRAYYRLGEQIATTASDASPYVNNGTYYGSPTMQANPATTENNNFALGPLNGTSQYVRVPHSNTLNLGDRFSIAAYVYPGATGATRGIVSKGIGAYLLRTNTTNNVQLIASYIQDIVTSTVALGAAAWSHVVVTKDGGDVKLYINNVDRTGTVQNMTCVNNVHPLHIGCDYDGSVTVDHSNHRLDEVQIYPYALSPGQVSLLYTAGTTNITEKYSPDYGDHFELISTSSTSDTVIAVDDWFITSATGSIKVNLTDATGAKAIQREDFTVLDQQYKDVQTGLVLGTTGRFTAVVYAADRDATIRFLKTCSDSQSVVYLKSPWADVWPIVIGQISVDYMESGAAAISSTFVQHSEA